MALSQGGFTFVAVAGGGVTPPQSFRGSRHRNGRRSAGPRKPARFRADSGLSVSPDSGSSSSTSFGTVTVSANPAGLAPGVYYGLVVVSSAGTVNSPQQFEVVLNVLASQQSAGATAAPSGLIFTAPAGGDSPSSQTFLLTNLNASSAALAVKVTTTDGGSWLVAAPDNGTHSGGRVADHHRPAQYRVAAGGRLSSGNSSAGRKHAAHGERCLRGSSFGDSGGRLIVDGACCHTGELHGNETLSGIHFPHSGFRDSGQLAIADPTASGRRLRKSDDQRASGHRFLKWRSAPLAGIATDWAMAGHLAWTQPESEPNRDYRQREHRFAGAARVD